MSRNYTKKAESRGIRIREAGMAHNQLGEGTTAEILALRAKVAELEEYSRTVLAECLEHKTRGIILRKALRGIVEEWDFATEGASSVAIETARVITGTPAEGVKNRLISDSTGFCGECIGGGRKLLPIGETQDGEKITDCLSELLAAVAGMGVLGSTRIPLVAIDIVAALERYYKGEWGAEQVEQEWERQCEVCNRRRVTDGDGKGG